MPLLTVRIGKLTDGNSLTIVLEHVPNVDYHRMGLIANAMANKRMGQSPVKGVEKSLAKTLLGMAQSDRERECLRYALVKE